MKIITVHYNNTDNITKHFLAQNVEWRIINTELMFYNTLFESVLVTKPKNPGLGLSFVETLENGCSDVLSLIKQTFDLPADAVYSLFVNKKIIE